MQYTYGIILMIGFFFLATPFPMTSSIEFQIPSISVNESDGSVIVNLISTGNLSDNITVCIDVTMVVDPNIIQRM